MIRVLVFLLVLGLVAMMLRGSIAALDRRFGRDRANRRYRWIVGTLTGLGLLLLILAATGKLGVLLAVPGLLLAGAVRVLPLVIRLSGHAQFGRWVRRILGVDPPAGRSGRAETASGGNRSQNSDRSRQHSSTRAHGQMDRREAMETLGLQGEPAREEIIAAHRRMMQRVHPDRGGSGPLAAKVNEARDLLLSRVA